MSYWSSTPTLLAALTCPSCGRWFDNGCDGHPSRGAEKGPFGIRETVCWGCARMLAAFEPKPTLAETMAAMQQPMALGRRA